jgi:hypothetical protein
MEPVPNTGILKLPLEDMAARHIGLTEFKAGCILEAARVCLDRHHTSPTDFSYQNDQEEGITIVHWEITDTRTRGAYNELDATEDGAYAIALAALEMLSGFVAVRRAEPSVPKSVSCPPSILGLRCRHCKSIASDTRAPE